jgi:elongator complex protein 3
MSARAAVGLEAGVRARFDPRAHRESLLAVLRELDALVREADAAGTPLPANALQRVLRRYPKDGVGLFSRGELIAGFRMFAGTAGLRVAEHAFVERIQMRPVRTQSGVTPVTVLSKPFPCPGKCVFCPNDVRMPKSYLSREPGAQRAAHNGFDPYLQTYNRLLAFAAIGHPLDKAELIVLGGTWSFYPEAYQRWFVKRCFDAMNDLARGLDQRAAAGLGSVDHEPLPAQMDGREPRLSYNRVLSRFLLAHHGPALIDAHEQASWQELEQAQRQNELGACRNVGLSVETRPDHVSERELVRLRRLGCTKVQIGIQSLSDRVLTLNKRGHDVAATRRAIRLLRAAGFKIQAHFMPNLLGSTPAQDLEDFQRLFDDPDFRPDELKVYPCSLVQSTELMRFYDAGQFRPYDDDQLLHVLRGVLVATPRYCRLSRVVRDISSSDIVAGNRRSNFREVAQQALSREGGRCHDIRSREIRHDDFDPQALSLRATCYDTALGQEQFLEICTSEDRLAGFLRLSLPSSASFIDEIADSAMIRELHVYGGALALGARHARMPQHRGFGRWLVNEAIARSRSAGYRALAVISAVGTRPYYRKLGFEDGELYQHFAL